ncbi:transposase [Daejeonia sp. YH14]|uniref:transposase n=1 Tax=Daejeonia sp. YH14 TaxID=3439042 RepID=UPI003F498102
MQLSDFGNIVKAEWLQSFEIRSELFCDEYIIMPNHLHAILEINRFVKTDGVAEPPHVKPPDSVSVNPIKRNMPTRLPKSISSFIAGFKSSVNTKIDDYIDLHQLDIPKYNRKNPFFQPNYHDHIIRNENEYLRIKEYIKNNPYQWTIDKLNQSKTSKP